MKERILRVLQLLTVEVYKMWRVFFKGFPLWHCVLLLHNTFVLKARKKEIVRKTLRNNTLKSGQEKQHFSRLKRRRNKRK